MDVSQRIRVPLSAPYVDDAEIERVAQVLRSGWYTHGPENEEFERRFAEYLGVKRAISVNSCTSALHLAVQAQGIRGEVIVPSFTFVASANAVITAGATPVFADIEYDTCNIAPADIEARITSRTEAIMPVHFAGQCCRMDEIVGIAERHGLAIIEDAAETLGGTFQGRQAGAFGVGCFSFFPTKNITTGEGGILTTNDDDLADRARVYAAHGIASTTLAREKQTRPWLRAATVPGYNFRMSNILAAVGVEQLKKLEQMNELRRRHARWLNERLAEFDAIERPVELPQCHHVYQMYTVKAPTIDRTAFIAGLRQRGVEASVHFDPPVHLQPYYVEGFGCRPGDLPVTEKVAASIVTLPMFPGLTEGQLEAMAQAIGESLAEARRV